MTEEAELFLVILVTMALLTYAFCFFCFVFAM